MKIKIIVSVLLVILVINDYPIYAVNKCTDGKGKVSYQEKRCSNDTKSETLDIQTSASPTKQFHKIPNQKWRFAYSAPKMKRIQENNSGRGYQYLGESKKTGFVMSMYVEPSRGKGTDKFECGNYYWQKASKNPMIMAGFPDNITYCTNSI